MQQQPTWGLGELTLGECHYPITLCFPLTWEGPRGVQKPLALRLPIPLVKRKDDFETKSNQTILAFTA